MLVAFAKNMFEYLKPEGKAIGLMNTQVKREDFEY